MQTTVTTYPLNGIIVGVRSKFLLKLLLMFFICLFFSLLACYIYQTGKLTQESYILAKSQQKLTNLMAEQDNLLAGDNLAGFSAIEQQALAMGFVKNDNIKFLTPDMPTLAKKTK